MQREQSYKAAGCTDTERAVLRLTEAAFGGEKLKPEEFSDTDWQAVFDELRAQAGAAVVMDALSDIEEIIPPEIFAEWLSYTVHVMGCVEHTLYMQTELQRLFSDNGIPLGILKGTAAAYDYPNPLCRNMGDIDFLVNKRDFNRAYKLMLDDGYELAYDEDNAHYHYTLEKGGIMFELHKEPAGLAENEKSDALRTLFADCCGAFERSEISDCEVYRLPRLQNGLVLLLHLVKHLDEGIGLRQVCDWFAFVQKELTDEVWKAEFEPVLKPAGLDNLARIVTKMCAIYLGLDGVTWCEDVMEADCAELMRFVLDNGNFGHKTAVTRRSMAVVGHIGESKHRFFVVEMLSNLQKDGVSQWKAVKRFPPLKCVAWGYIPIRYIYKLCIGQRTISETKKLAETIGTQKNLQDRLAIFK